MKACQATAALSITPISSTWFSREAQTISAELLRLPYSRSSFERVGHEVAKRYRHGRSRIETRLIEVPEGARSVSVSIDRVSLPMEELPPRWPHAASLAA